MEQRRVPELPAQVGHNTWFITLLAMRCALGVVRIVLGKLFAKIGRQLVVLPRLVEVPQVLLRLAHRVERLGVLGGQGPASSPAAASSNCF